MKKVLTCAILSASICATAFAQSGPKWSTGGNSTGPNAFLGTTNNRPLNFKTNGLGRMKLTASGWLGIGTSTPAALLDVNGTFRLDDGTQQLGYVLTTDASGNASWQALPPPPTPIWSTNPVGIDYNGGNVGVGTSAPFEKLHVSGNGRFDGKIGVNKTPGALIEAMSTNPPLGAETFFQLRRSDLSLAFQVKAGGIGDAFMELMNNAGTAKIHLHANSPSYINNGQNFGIGTTSPTELLTVAGVVESTGGFKFPDGSVQTSASSLFGTVSNPYTSLYVNEFIKVGTNSLYLDGGFGGATNHIYVSDASGDMHLNSPTGGEANLASTNANTIINANNSTGNVGIGTTTPTYKLHVDNGTLGTAIRADAINGQLRLFETDGVAGTYTQIERNGDAFHIYQNDGSGFTHLLTGTMGGQLGIGTTAPNARFHVKDDGTVALDAHLEGFTLLDGPQASLLLGATTGAPYGEWGIEYNQGAGGLNFWRPAGSSGFGNYFMFIANNGNVGINTSTPSYKLHVRNSSTSSGTAIRADAINGQIRLFETDGSAGSYTQIERNGDAFHIYQNDGSGFQHVLTGTADGKVGIGTTDPQGYELAVKGDVIAESVTVKLYGTWPDYVFGEEYQLMDLYEVEDFINAERHLPNVPSEVEVTEGGINVGEMNKILLQKVEELTLYVIELRKEIDTLKQ